MSEKYKAIGSSITLIDMSVEDMKKKLYGV